MATRTPEELKEVRQANAARARQAMAEKVAIGRRADAIAYIKRMSDTLPPLTEAQRADLAALLRGSEGAA